MIAVIQRVSQAEVFINQLCQSKIEKGLLIFLGIGVDDNKNDIEWLSKKIVNLRIFEDEDDKMNKSLLDVGGEALLVSQFTLHASTKKGNRPSFIESAKPTIAIPLYEEMIESLENLLSKKVKTGLFGANMKVSLYNEGPVTIIIDTKNKR